MEQDNGGTLGRGDLTAGRFHHIEVCFMLYIGSRSSYGIDPEHHVSVEHAWAEAKLRSVLVPASGTEWRLVALVAYCRVLPMRAGLGLAGLVTQGQNPDFKINVCLLQILRSPSLSHRRFECRGLLSAAGAVTELVAIEGCPVLCPFLAFSNRTRG
jgi:hypothetical protein